MERGTTAVTYSIYSRLVTVCLAMFSFPSESRPTTSFPFATLLPSLSSFGNMARPRLCSQLISVSNMALMDSRTRMRSFCRLSIFGGARIGFFETPASGLTGCLAFDAAALVAAAEP